MTTDTIEYSQGKFLLHFYSSTESDYFILPAVSLMLAAFNVALLISNSCRSLSTSCCSSWAFFFQPSSRLFSLQARASAYSLPLRPEGLLFITVAAKATLAFMKNHSAWFVPEIERGGQIYGTSKFSHFITFFFFLNKKKKSFTKA